MKILRLFVIIFTTFFLYACAHTPTRGDKMQTHSSRAEMLGQKWNEADQLIAEGKTQRTKGHDLIDKGQKQIISGTSAISEGNSNISSGTELLEQGQAKIEHGYIMKKESEIAFKEHFPNTSLQ